MAGLLLFAAACGSAPPKPAPRDDGPTCAAVADHLVALAEADNRTTPTAELATGIRGEAEHQCTSTPWSPARRHCLATATSQDDTLGCPSC